MVLGKHTLADLEKCYSDLDNIEFIEKTMIDSIKDANLTVVESNFHKMAPTGISGVIILVESHVTIHTWPEHNFASIDAFTCGEKFDPSNVCMLIAKRLKANIIKINKTERGTL